MAVGFMQRASRNMPEISGGAVGVGVPITLRETVDIDDSGQRVSLIGSPDSMLGKFTTPSALWGLGVGALTGIGWAADVGDDAIRDFMLAHTATGIPTGIAVGLLPKQPSGTAAAQRALREGRSRSSDVRSRRRSSGSRSAPRSSSRKRSQSRSPVAAAGGHDGQRPRRAMRQTR